MDATGYLEFIARSFAEYHIDAVMIGNAAAALQGAPVTTVDVDFLFCQKDLRDTFRKLVALAQQYEYTFMEIERTARGYRMFRLEEKRTGFAIDILFEADGIQYETIFPRASKVCFGKHFLYVASLEDVLMSKKSSNRLKDVATIPLLEMTLHEKERLQKAGDGDCRIQDSEK